MNLIIMDQSNNYINYIVANSLAKAEEAFPNHVIINYDTVEGNALMEELIANNYNKD